MSHDEIDLTPTPSSRLDGRRALVTGAGRGIGLTAASALADAGAHVTLAARTTSEIEEAADAIRARGQQADALTLDVTDIDAVRKALAERAPYQILVNNAGMNRPAMLPDVTVEDFDAILTLNVRAAFFVAQTVATRLLDEKLPGSIINISSQMGHVGAARRTVYCASKHAMEGFTKAMAIELAPHNIRVNSLGPTFLETPMTRPFFENKAFRDEVLVEDQARPARAVGGALRRHRVPGVGRLVADDGFGAQARRRLDGGVTGPATCSCNTGRSAKRTHAEDST